MDLIVRDSSMIEELMFHKEKPMLYDLKYSFKANARTQEEQSKFLQEGEYIRSELAKRQIEDQKERMRRPLYKRVLSLIPWIYN